MQAGGCQAEGKERDGSKGRAEEEEDSPVECSGGETKQLAFIPGEVSGPIPFHDRQEKKIIFLHRARTSKRRGRGRRGAWAQKASKGGRWRLANHVKRQMKAGAANAKVSLYV